MSYADNPDGWHRLRDAYAQMPDEELLELNGQFDGLTDDAQTLLRNEFTRRKLSALQTATIEAEEPLESDAEVSEAEVETYFPRGLLQMAGVALCECDTTDEAKFVMFILGEERIDSVIRDYLGSGDLRLPQVLVAPDDLEKAKHILSSANFEELRPRHEAESAITSRDFESPKCPSCSSEEVMLKSVDPANTWICDACGSTWQEATPDPNA